MPTINKEMRRPIVKRGIFLLFMKFNERINYENIIFRPLQKVKCLPSRVVLLFSAAVLPVAALVWLCSALHFLFI